LAKEGAVAVLVAQQTFYLIIGFNVLDGRFFAEKCATAQPNLMVRLLVLLNY
jgi:hypothetical protein